MIALDASALLAYLFRETGHEHVGAVLSGCCLSTVNLAEVLGRFTRDGHDVDTVLARIRSSPIELVAVQAKEAAAMARLLPATQALGLSLGDRACLALAQLRRIPAMTADRAWSGLNIGVEIRLIR